MSYPNEEVNCNELLCPCNTVAEPFTHNPKMEGSKPAPGTGRETMVRNSKLVGLSLLVTSP